jgi:hypothetical protein
MLERKAIFGDKREIEELSSQATIYIYIYIYIYYMNGGTVSPCDDSGELYASRQLATDRTKTYDNKRR